VPTYDYRCTDCGREIEVVHGIHDSGPSTCEVCGGAMRKAPSPPAILFRGAGWAKKDARAASATKAAAGAGSSAGERSSSEGATGAGAGTKDADAGPAATPATSSKSDAVVSKPASASKPGATE
jgi:putative FmdB family regulatory protein